MNGLYGKCNEITLIGKPHTMAQMQIPINSGKTKKKTAGSLHIDMTPMVDLGFLLITFFIFTTTMAEKRAVKLVMPKDGEPMPLAESRVLTAVLGNDNKVFVYAGRWEDAIKKKQIAQTDYTPLGLRTFIKAKQQQLKNERDKLMFLIKPGNQSSYKNLIGALDEALINKIERYAIVQPTTEENGYIQHR